MPVTRWAISLDKELAKQIKSVAREPISAWLADAARRKLRRDGLLNVISDWEKEFGSISDEELAAARKRYESSPTASELRKKRKR